jgi:hypothetical protein
MFSLVGVSRDGKIMLVIRQFKECWKTPIGPIFKGQAWPLNMRPIDCPETSVTNYHSTLLKSQKSEDFIYTAKEAWNYNSYFLKLLIVQFGFNHITNLLKPTGYVMHHQFNIQQLYALSTLYLCFVFIWERTATCATYCINWLVFTTEMKSVSGRDWFFK